MAYQDWDFAVGDPWSGAYFGDLSRATSRQVTWYMTQPCTAQFTLEGRDPQAALIDEPNTDLFVARNGDLLFRGRFGSSQDQIGGAPQHLCQFNAVDYRGLLQRKIIWPWWTTAFDAVPQEDIAWSLVNAAQNETGGDLGIQQGIWPSSATYARIVQFNVGDIVENDITTMAAYANGFDWEIDCNKRMNLWYPNRGNTLDLPLVYGDNVTNVTRTLDTTQYATGVLYQGGTHSRVDSVTFTAGSTFVADGWIQPNDNFTTIGYVAGVNGLPSSASITSLYPGSGFYMDSAAAASGVGYVLLTGEQLTDAYATLPAGTAPGDLGPPPGRWESNISDSSIIDQTALQDAADGELQLLGALQPSYALTLSPNWWNPSLIWLGDSVQVVVMSGRLQVNTYLPVSQITVTLDDAASTEQVVITCGPLINNLGLRLRDYDMRFARLATR